MTQRKRRTLSTAMLALALTAAGLTGLTPTPARAAVTTTGSIYDSGGNYRVGNTSDGTLQIDAGSSLSRINGHIGYDIGANGTVIVADSDSMWTLSQSLHIGQDGNGVLAIRNGGQVANSTAAIGSGTQGMGTAIVTGASSTWINSGLLLVGQNENGFLTIENGGTVINTFANIGTGSEVVGTATIAGVGSTWINNEELYIGYHGSGILTIKNGGQVKNTIGYISTYAGSDGTATVTGPGSKWVNSDSLLVGAGPLFPVPGIGVLNIADDGQIIAKRLKIGYTVQLTGLSMVNIHVSNNNMIMLGDATTTGSVDNFGIINFYADPFLAAGAYTPISEYAGRSMTWYINGLSKYNAWGGTWDGTNHTFTVSAPTALGAGDVDSVSSGERLLITDAASGHHVGASFGTVTGGTTFAASMMTSGELDALAAALASTGGAGDVLAGWDFTTNFTGGTVMLSFDLGLGMSDVQVWHYSGGAWSLVTPDLLTYDSHGILSFTVDSFSGYGVTGVAPEPASLVLLTLGALGLIQRRRR